MSQTAKDTAEFVGSFLNGVMRSERAEFIREMSFQHRTLQQTFTSICLSWLNHLASLKDGEGAYDQRNEASVKIARQIKAACPDIEWGVPLI